jgi:hypothetical protein
MFSGFIRKLEEPVNLQSRCALLKQFAPQYRQASSAQKRVLLDVFAQATLLLLHRSQEAVLAALQHARPLLPFPILGIDTDNGGEFVNEAVIAYCEQEQITFTQGRPYLKNDHCFME